MTWMMTYEQHKYNALSLEIMMSKSKGWHILDLETACSS